MGSSTLRSAKCQIYPPIGIARLGNSPDEFFIGPEVRDIVPNDGKPYKDAKGRIKRQAARFHVFALDADGKAITELEVGKPVGDDITVTSITWTVTLANAKPAWYEFHGTRGVEQVLRPDGRKPPWRNADIAVPDRVRLTIGPVTQTIGGANQCRGPMKGRFLTWPDEIKLGELRTDELGRLLVLGGHGASGNTEPDNPLTHYANNDRWFDDTSDGRVSVRVEFSEGDPMTAHAWAIVAPPHYSPHTQSLVTAYDVMLDAAMRHGLPPAALPTPSGEVSFQEDILPILRRLSRYQWVSDRARRGHSAGTPGDLLDQDMLDKLADPSATSAPDRTRLFARLRTPLHCPGLPEHPEELKPSSQAAINQANLSFMPPLSGDQGDATHPIYDDTTNCGAPQTWLTVTATQYSKLRRWSEGDFKPDWDGTASPPPRRASIDQVEPSQRPYELTRASLEACQGGPFFPGIEFTSIIRFKELYAEAFRFHDGLEPGDITKWMAVPWQADFYECRDRWWPAIRPDDVVPAHEYERWPEIGPGAPAPPANALPRKPWARGIGAPIPPRPALPSWPPPIWDAPEYAAVTTADDLRKLTQRQLKRLVGTYLSAVPAPDPNDVEQIYYDRLQDFLHRTGVTGFTPDKPEEWTLRQYWGERDDPQPNTIIGWLTSHLTERTQVPEPYGLSITDYADVVRKRAEDKDSAYSSLWQALLDIGWRHRYRNRGKNDFVGSRWTRHGAAANWSRLGFVTRRPDAGGEVYVETDRGRYEMLPFRDYFHILLNLEQHSGFTDTAKELADEYLYLAERFAALTDGSVPPQYDHFPYDTTAFNTRLNAIYDQLSRDADAYDPGAGLHEPLLSTPDQLVERTRQMAPFNQLDGAWLKNITGAGFNADITGLLQRIWSDEQGNGNPLHNHATVYTGLLASLGIRLPDIGSPQYAADPTLWDSSFVSPVYQLAIAQFPAAYGPELLGMTLFLEWEAVALRRMVKLYEYHGFNPLFYQLHVGIDNAANGHGAMARDAVVRYLAHVRSEGGEQNVQDKWRRIWNGYLAFATVGGTGWHYHLTNPPTMHERVVAMIEQKKQAAQQNHGTKRLGPNFVNDWFDEPDAFVQQLVRSDLIVTGDAANSRLFKLLDFDGPMFTVFDEQDRRLLTEYINSMPSAPPGAALDAKNAMIVLLTRLSARAMAVPDHHDAVLTGAYLEPSTGQSATETQPLSWWFKLGQPRNLMKALAASHWVVPGDAAASPLVRNLLSEPQRMARFLAQPMPEIGGRTPREVIVQWIAARCPVPLEEERAPAQAPVRPVPRTRLRMGLSLLGPLPTPEAAAGAPPVEAAPGEPHADVLYARTIRAVHLTPQQLVQVRCRRYGPGGGACH